MLNSVLRHLPVYGEWIRIKEFVNNVNKVNYMFGLPEIKLTFMEWFINGRQEKDIRRWIKQIQNGFCDKPRISCFINSPKLAIQFEYCEHKMCKTCLNQQRVYWAGVAQHTDIETIKKYYNKVNNDVKLLVRKSSNTVISFK